MHFYIFLVEVNFSINSTCGNSHMILECKNRGMGMASLDSKLFEVSGRSCPSHYPQFLHHFYLKHVLTFLQEAGY